MTFLTGLNPYGFTYTLGLQGAGTPRANPAGTGLEGFLATNRDIGARCIEFDHRWLTPMSGDALRALRDSIAGMTPVCSSWLTQGEGETLADAVRCARAIGSRTIRMNLTPVLEGSRAAWGARWQEMLMHARKTLRREAPRVIDAGLQIAIEDHQDLGSEELLEIATTCGDHVGITLDTGNPFAVGEDPVAFTRRVAARVRHVHFKDYRAQFSDEGYRLVRCAIGDGAVPFAEIASVLAAHHDTMTASIEPGALEARHIRVFMADWWEGYGPRAADEFARALGRLRSRREADEADVRTPWEHEAPAAEIVSYERDQIRRSVEFMRARGWL